MRFVLLFGCLSLSACAAVVTVRLRSLNRNPARFPPIYGKIQRYVASGHLQKSLSRSGDSSV
jgi:hypothetical protein